MKKLLLLGYLSALFLLSPAQEQQKMSDVEKFCKTPGKNIVGHLIYQTSLGVWGTEKVIVMKYIDPVAKDTISGLTFAYDVNSGSGNNCSLNTLYEVMIDLDEFSRIVKWVELYQGLKENEDTSLGYLSYVPEKGSFMIKIKRRKREKGSAYVSNNWDFIFQADKFNANSQISYTANFSTIIDKLKEIQRAIEN